MSDTNNATEKPASDKELREAVSDEGLKSVAGGRVADDNLGSIAGGAMSDDELGGISGGAAGGKGG